MQRNERLIGGIFVAGGVLFLIMTVGLFLQQSWATILWPWPDGRLSYIFLASITAAIAAPMIWIGLSREFGAARGGAVNLAITTAGTAGYLFYLNSRSPDARVLITAIIFSFFFLLNLGIYFWSRPIPIRDQRDKPIMVEFSFVLFIIILVLVGTALIRQATQIFPWPLKPESSVIFGLIFIGAAFYFFIALRMPHWHSARGQLIGFLAYDLVLLGPFLAHFSTVLPEHRTSLTIYMIVIAYSGLLAIYYLFIDPNTRPWHIEQAEPDVQATAES